MDGPAKARPLFPGEMRSSVHSRRRGYPSLSRGHEAISDNVPGLATCAKRMWRSEAEPKPPKAAQR
jgi:hypothetical protein